jgi:hypothetical protein
MQRANRQLSVFNFAPAALFHATISWRFIGPFTPAPIVIAGVLALVSIALLLTTALMDPGFIPRQPDDIEQG